MSRAARADHQRVLRPTLSTAGRERWLCEPWKANGSTGCEAGVCLRRLHQLRLGQ